MSAKVLSFCVITNKQEVKFFQNVVFIIFSFVFVSIYKIYYSHKYQLCSFQYRRILKITFDGF